MQGGGRLLCPLQLPDKEHRLPAVDALQGSRPSLPAHATQALSPGGASRQGGERVGGGGPPGPASPHAACTAPPASPALPSAALEEDCLELVKRVSAFVIP